MLYWYEESMIDVYQNLLYFLYQGMKLCGLEAFFQSFGTNYDIQDL